ncbi:MAG: GNAT family N-acetyltransferase [Chloroflexi bacterium]|nr:GNAT family N-acetyltransferase [Chloroflexota bacterium]
MSSFVTQIENAPITGATLRELTRVVLEHGKPFRFTARGYSMSPFIQDGDAITLAPFADAPHIGEVVAFINPASDRLVVHRLIAETSDGFVLKGDNIAEPDGVFARAQILGRVVRVERDGKTVGGGIGAERAAIAFLSREQILLALKALYYFPRRVAGVMLRRAQNLAPYRALGRRVQPRVVIAEASDAELAEVQRRFNPGVWMRSTPRNPNATHYVAKIGDDLAGFVELVRHPPAHFPYVGHWLFSLHVWTRWRGCGIGELLTRQAMMQAQSEGAHELRLIVFADNAPAIKLYRKLGFAICDAPEFTRVLHDKARVNGRRRVVMRCVLSRQSLAVIRGSLIAPSGITNNAE